MLRRPPPSQIRRSAGQPQLGGASSLLRLAAGSAPPSTLGASLRLALPRGSVLVPRRELTHQLSLFGPPAARHGA
jgi:hypothetical protein